MSLSVAPKAKRKGEPAGARAAQLQELRGAFRHTLRLVNRLRGRDTHLAAGELSHAQFELLVELDERGPLPAGELATAAQLSAGTVTQMLDHLAACGHVERLRSQSDRRVVVSRLTGQGQRQIEAKREAFQQRWEEALEGVDLAELRGATKVFERVIAMLEESPPASAEAPPEGDRAEPKAGAKRAAQPSRE